MKKILLILTGGTFGMATNQAKTLETTQIENELFTLVPELKTLANIQVQSVFNIDSSDINPIHWIIIADLIEANMFSYDGFVIIHGTDTMAYTASALSFMLSFLPKPVILTGSQRPLKEIRSDARNNLINAIECATLEIPEVAICFDYKVFRGNRSKKISIDDFDAFTSPNFPPLASIGIQIELSEKIKKDKGMFQVYKTFDTSVLTFALFPGLNPKDLEILIHSNIRAVILEAYGSGNVPTLDDGFITLIQSLNDVGKIVAIKSQCVRGACDLSLYSGGKKALEAGAISCQDMTREASIVKMMFLLGRFSENHLIKENYYISLNGELS